MYKECLIFATVFWALDKFIPLKSCYEHGDVWIMGKLKLNSLGYIVDSEFITDGYLNKVNT